MGSITPDQYFTPLKGQSLLYPGQAEKYRGQCVQSVKLWYTEVTGLPAPSHELAYQYYDAGIPGYTKIPAGGPIKTGDIIVWSKYFPASPGAGHIDVAATDGTVNDFYAWDSNWSPPLKLSKIHHNGHDNNYIVGYLRKNEGEEVKATRQDIINAYNGLMAYNPTEAEIEGYLDSGKDRGTVWQEIYDYAVSKKLDYFSYKASDNPDATVLKPGIYKVQ